MKRIHLLGPALLLSLALACSKDPPPQPTQVTSAPPPPPAKPKLDKVPRADVNRLAAELALPLFWSQDKNNDKVLTPGNVASYTVQGQTDANGVAVLNIVYPKSFAQWAQMQLEVTASVGGTEGFSAMTIPLPILAADVTNEQVAPPSIARTRGSLTGEGGVLFAPGSGNEITAPSMNQLVAGSPFPYLSVTPTCPIP